MGSSRPEPKILRVDGIDLPLQVRRHGRARRITLRLDHKGEALHLVLPKRASLREALAFAANQSDWVARRLGERPPRVPFEHDRDVPILGEPHRIVHCAEARRGVWLEPGRLCVSGRADHLARRVTDFLCRHSRATIVQRVGEKAERLGQTPRRITIRDTHSRWGSCTPHGNLSFSWRLILAPDYVFDYVVAHEVAHLVELNHGPRFWRLTGSITERMGAARLWLRRHGTELHRYG